MDQQTPRNRNDPYLDLEKTAGASDRLNIFRERVGITDVLELGPRPSKRKSPNIGIYNRVATEEREAKLQYMFSALVINTCLLAQVVFASALTALGAGNGSHTQITILGAANTVIAAVLTFTKGQGLPNRLRQYQCSLRKIREHIEQRERDFAGSDCRLDVDLEMQRIIKMYEEVRQTDENNDPSTYHASTTLPVKEPTPPMNKSTPSSTKSKESVVTRQVATSDAPKEEVDLTSLNSRDKHTDLARHSADSERWKIAYTVAERLVSGNYKPPTEYRVHGFGS